MKLKVAYLPGEEKEAGVLVECAKAILPGAKIKEICQHPPFQHIYISKKPPEHISDYGSMLKFRTV